MTAETEEVRRGPGRPRKTERDEDAPPRRKRTPLGVPRRRLTGRVPKGMVGRYMNDVPGRIQSALDAGYVFIGEAGERSDSRDGAASARVGVNSDGSPLLAFLMAIPEELYREDQATKQADIDRFDDAVRRGNLSGADPRDNRSFYVASEGISLRRD